MIELPKINVSSFHMNQVVYLIGSKKIGRRKIAKEIGLSESKTRTMLNHLTKLNYIKPAKKGYKLKKKGEKLFKKIKSKVKEIKRVEAKEITMDKQNLAMLLSNTSKKIGSGIALRDEAIKAGATGMTVLVYKNRGFCFPIKSDLKYSAKELEKLKKEFPQAKENNVLLISSANEEEKAKKGLWKAFNIMI